MKYDARACHFNMDTGCVELLLRDGRKISIDGTGVEDALDVTMAQQTELDYLIYNDPLGYADWKPSILYIWGLTQNRTYALATIEYLAKYLPALCSLFGGEHS